MKRWLVLGSDDEVRWAWDTKYNKFYRYDLETDAGALSHVTSVQQISKFDPFVTVLSESTKAPEWVGRSPGDNEAKLMGDS